MPRERIPVLEDMWIVEQEDDRIEERVAVEELDVTSLKRISWRRYKVFFQVQVVYEFECPSLSVNKLYV